jgi:hypothetical protein
MEQTPGMRRRNRLPTVPNNPKNRNFHIGHMALKDVGFETGAGAPSSTNDLRKAEDRWLRRLRSNRLETNDPRGADDEIRTRDIDLGKAICLSMFSDPAAFGAWKRGDSCWLLRGA